MVLGSKEYTAEVQGGIGIGPIKCYVPGGSTQHWVSWDGKCLLQR